ncbi:hypothetical protein H4R19_005912 [Coemansia spiralis]|nr:hypothetical protein H4R19_005912 [Coemansia spiralis]
MLLLRVRKSGAPLTTVTYEIDYEAGNAGPPAAPQHIEGQYTQNTKSDGGYYASSPQVAMPAPTN